MAYSVSYKKTVNKDLQHIDKRQARIIIDKIEHQLCRDPQAGKALVGEFKGLYRIRVGDYRVVYTILENIVLVLRVAHRKDVYR